MHYSKIHDGIVLHHDLSADLILFTVFSRGDPYYGEDMMSVLQAVRNASLEPAYRPKVPEDCHEQVQAVMQVLIEQHELH